jgi:hypothetical protein
MHIVKRVYFQNLAEIIAALYICDCVCRMTYFEISGTQLSDTF